MTHGREGGYGERSWVGPAFFQGPIIVELDVWRSICPLQNLAHFWSDVLRVGFGSNWPRRQVLELILNGLMAYRLLIHIVERTCTYKQNDRKRQHILHCM